MQKALGTLGRKSVVLNSERLSQANWRLEGADPRETIEWAVETYGDGLALSASFGGGEGMALLGHDLQNNRQSHRSYYRHGLSSSKKPPSFGKRSFDGTSYL